MKLFKTIDTSFEKFDNTINQYLSKALNAIGIQYSNNQLFGIIFNGIKGVMQNAMFYIEDALTEQNIFKASRKQSVYSLAKVSGYEAYYGSAASGLLLGKLEINNGLDSKSTKVFIHNHCTVRNKNTGVEYSIILPTDTYVFDVSKPLVTHQFKIVQGEYERYVYSAKGTSLEAIHITSLQLFDRSYIEVKVNGETWEEVGNLYDMNEDGHEYMLSIGYDNTFDIIFGNGIYGKVLTEGDSVTIDYLKHSGETGNISENTATDFIFSEYGKDSLGNNININDYMKLTMSTCVSGGTDSDTIDFIRNMVGTNSRSLVLASEDNFRLFFKRFSFIGYVSCWSESNNMTVNVVALTNIKENLKSNKDYLKFDAKDMVLNKEQKDMILNTLENSKKTFAGITINFKDPVIRKYAFLCYVKIDNVYVKDTVRDSIRNTLLDYFINLKDSTQFISKAELISNIINNCSDIKGLDINIISEAAEKAYYENSYIKYELKHSNGVYYYIPVKHTYDKSDLPGLDEYGNISLDSKLEVPMLHGEFKYYPEKENNKNKKDSIMINDIEIYFI